VVQIPCNCAGQSISQTHCLLTLLAEMTGHEIGSFIIWNFEYGPNYSGPR